jgi:hypothetical protein
LGGGITNGLLYEEQVPIRSYPVQDTIRDMERERLEERRLPTRAGLKAPTNINSSHIKSEKVHCCCIFQIGST